jgi:anti-sigma factor RsiW
MTDKNAQCMSCLSKLDSYVDNETDAADAAAILVHIQGCGSCRSAIEETDTLSATLKKNLPYHAAPPELTEKILLSLKQDNPSVRPTVHRGAGSWWRWTLPGTSAAMLALSLTLFLLSPSVEDMLADEVVAGHVRSLMEQHMTDVLSSDRHTVKPWFAGKLDFTPPVHDFKEQGYELVGGRLDYLRHQTAAALVYRHKKHIINVFIAPASPRSTDAAVHYISRRGYNLTLWQKDGLSFEAVSDMSSDELKTLCSLIAEAS